MLMSKYTKRYLHEYILEKEDKELLLESFKTRKKYKRVDKNNYLEVYEFERSVKVYDIEFKDYLEEVRYLPLGTIDFWNVLSSACQKHVNNYFYSRYKNELLFESNYFAGDEELRENKFIEKKLSRLKEYALHNDLDCIDNDGIMDPDFISNAFCTNRIVNPALIKLEIIVYAIKELELKLIDFDDGGNIMISDYAYEKYIDKTETLPLATDERLRKSVSQSYQAFKNYALCNADKFKYFVTLTFADINEKEKHIELNNNRRINDISLTFEYIEDASCYDYCVKEMTYFLNKMKKYLKRKGYEFYYLGVPEYQKNGNIHYHFLMSDIPSEYMYKVPDWLDRDYNTNKICNSTGLTLWNYGKSDVSVINSKSRISTYISKYMIKSLKNINCSEYMLRLYKKRFYNSNNLSKPIVEYCSVNEEVENYYSRHTDLRVSKFDNTFIKRDTYMIVDLD